MDPHVEPLNAAQRLYLPWLHARIENGPPRHGFVPRGTPARGRSNLRLRQGLDGEDKLTTRGERKRVARVCANAQVRG